MIIKSHGSMDSVGFAGAIEVGYDMARHKLLDKIRETITLSSEAEASALPPPADDATRG